MNILITGATGFIGKYLTKSLCSDHVVKVVVRDEAKARSTFGNSVKYLSTKSSSFLDELKSLKVDVVFHLAGNSSFNETPEVCRLLIEDNIQFGTLLLQGLSNSNVKLFVNFTSSLSFLENEKQATNFYASTKLAFSEILNYMQSKSGFKVLDLVLYAVYGKGDTTKRAINYVIDSIVSTEPLLMSPGNQQLDFIHVDDVIKLCGLCIDSMDGFTSYSRIHVGTGISTSLRQLAVIVEDAMGVKPNITWGGIPYRTNEKLINVAPVHLNSFWKAEIKLNEGILSMK
jgi:CDP-paratose synthetase